MALGAKRLPENSTARYIAAFNDEHEAIAKAFQYGDSVGLRTLLIAHFNDTEEAMRRIFEKLSANPTGK
jgi:DNA-binding GntR family transcriptional regulator